MTTALTKPVSEFKHVSVGVFKSKTGSWMQTWTGARVSILNPQPEQICIKDIAQPISLQCRYNGHCSEFYSVAQHCVLGTLEFIKRGDLEHAKEFLLHDATEAYVGDLIRPVKREIPEFLEVEARFAKAIAGAFGLPEGMSKEVSDMDHIMLTWEKRDLLPNSEKWPNLPDITEYNFPTMECWDWKTSRDQYLKLFEALFNAYPNN